MTPSRKGAPVELLKEPFGEDVTVHPVTVEYFNPLACAVCLAGGFNEWNPSATPMTKQHDGKWPNEVLLKPGYHEYRFVVDGEWQDDPLASRFVSHMFGGVNSVVELKPTSV